MRGQGSIYKRKGRQPWYIAYRDHTKKRIVECTETTVKSAAARILALRIADVAMRRTGVIDVRAEKQAEQAKLTVEHHLADYKNMLEARQRSVKHIDRTLKFIREIAKLCGWMLVGDIGPDCLNKAAADMRAEGWAARTIQARIVACKAFVKWMVDHNKLPTNPLGSVQRPSVQADRRHRRRMLLPDEWPWLRDATLADGERNGLTPAERVALYMLIIQTGMRAAEVEALTKAKLILLGDRPHVLLRAEGTKNKREARQYITKDLAADLAALLSSKMPAAPAFSVHTLEDLAETLREDLADARRAWLAEAKVGSAECEKREQSDFLKPANDQGERLDLHALRHTCGAWLAIDRANIKTIQTIMRHSTIQLTFDTYGHLMPDSAADAVASMGQMFSPTKKAKGAG